MEGVCHVFSGGLGLLPFFPSPKYSTCCPPTPQSNVPRDRTELYTADRHIPLLGLVSDAGREGGGGATCGTRAV